jgi:hypothetical protein
LSAGAEELATGAVVPQRFFWLQAGQFGAVPHLTHAGCVGTDAKQARTGEPSRMEEDT